MNRDLFNVVTAFGVSLLLGACDTHTSPPEGTYVGIEAQNCHLCRSYAILVSETGAVTFMSYHDSRNVDITRKQVDPQKFIDLREVIDELDAFDLGEDPQRTCARDGPRLQVKDDLHSSDPKVSPIVTLFMSCARDREPAGAIAKAFVDATGTADLVLDRWPRENEK